jgi:hypothetical protein
VEFIIHDDGLSPETQWFWVHGIGRLAIDNSDRTLGHNRTQLAQAQAQAQALLDTAGSCLMCAGLPVQLPRRASAYDVYAVRSGDPGVGGGLNPAALAAAVANVSRQQQQQQSQQPSIRRASFICLLLYAHLVFSVMIFCIILFLFYALPIAVGERSKARTVFASPTLRSWVRIPLRHGCLCSVCVFLFLHSLKRDSQPT